MEKNKKFSELMKKNGFSVARLASALGVSKMAVRNWLNGRNRPSVPQLIKTSALFGLTIETLYAAFKGDTLTK